MLRNRSLFLATLLVLILALVSPVAAGPSVPGLPVANDGADTAISVNYIVVLADSASDLDVEAAIRDTGNADSRGVGVTYRYSAALKGFAATLTPGQVASLRKNPKVSYVEADQIITIADAQTPTPSWGLDRIDQAALPLNNTYNYNSTGAGVTAYVIDTGIMTTHTAFGGRASIGADTVLDGRNGVDCNGHGTHVAGTIGGAAYGVAKGVNLVAVRVLNCAGSGTTSGVIAGIDWVTKNHKDPAVANMSLGGGASTSLDTAVNNSIKAGITYAIAAGNSNADACRYSPARVAAAITVGATQSNDARASYSNYGSCLDLFAPGTSITSAWIGSTTATNTISGTSMATPHVAGVAALYLAAHGVQTPATVRNAIVNGATSNKVTSAGSKSPNKLLYSLLP